LHLFFCFNARFILILFKLKKLHPVVVSSNIEIAPEAFVLSFPRSFDFIPGQVVAIGTDLVAEPRLYSISSGNQLDEIWILYTVNPDGLLTPELAKLSKGNTIYVSEPFGRFTGNDDPAIWIATGTGIAPFASMFFSSPSNNKILIQGNRNLPGLYFYDEFSAKLGPNYHPCCSREEVEGCYHGRVTEFLQTFSIPDLSIPFYLCGSAEMVVDVRDILIEKGVPYDKILAEIFF
jgi:ferredoxin/flavodoxin---NADP+ reductase